MNTMVRSGIAGAACLLGVAVVGCGSEAVEGSPTAVTQAGGFRDVLQQHTNTVIQLRDLFDKAGRAYREADTRAADMIATRTEGP